MNKKIVNTELKALEQYGYEVFNFNHNKHMPAGSVGWVDFVIIGKGRVWFVECKFGKDKFSERQSLFADFMQKQTFASDNHIFYDVIKTGKDLDRVKLNILNWKKRYE